MLVNQNELGVVTAAAVVGTAAAVGAGVSTGVRAVNQAAEQWEEWTGSESVASTCTLNAGVYTCSGAGGTFTCPAGYEPIRTSVFHDSPKQRLAYGPAKVVGGRVCFRATAPAQGQCAMPLINDVGVPTFGSLEQSRIFHPTPKTRLVGRGRPDGGVMRSGKICLDLVRPTPGASAPGIGDQIAVGPIGAPEAAGVSGPGILPAVAVIGALFLIFKK